MVALLLLALIFVAIAAALVARVITQPRARAAERVAQIEAYGFTGDRPLEITARRPEGGGWLANGVSRIGELVERYLGRVREEDLRFELMAAGMYSMSPRTLLGYRLIAAVLAPILVLILGGGSGVAVLFAAVSIPAAWMLPITLVRRRARLRLERIDYALPELIDLLVVTVEAGLGFSASLRLAGGQFSGPLADELRLTLQEQTMGLSMHDSLENLVHRANTPAMRSFVRSVIQGEGLGVSIGTIMRNLAEDMRKRRRKAAEERAQKAPVKMLFPLVFLIFPTILIVIFLPAVYAFQNGFG